MAAAPALAALKCEDPAALGGGSHLNDLPLLAELTAVRLRRVHRTLDPAFGIRHFAALLVSRDASCASARAGTPCKRHHARDSQSGLPRLRPAHYRLFTHA